jgi:thiol-disulfide isomerase/thioredoxin
MDTLTTFGIVAGLIALTTAVGVAWKSRQGAVENRLTPGAIPPRLRSPGKQLTLLQVSSELCSYCAAMRRVLSQAAGTSVGVGHVEIDADVESDLVASLGVSQTPTTMIVRSSGDIVTWIRGPATPAAVADAIDEAMRNLEKESNDWSI